MFTGIVAEQITILQIESTSTGLTVALSLPQWGKLAVGESVLLHGICSTVTSITDAKFTVDYIPETVRVTTVGQWQVGQTVHAEPSVTPTTKLSGSFVFGHVDVALPVAGSHPLTFSIPEAYRAYVFDKGSITVNGVNLTVASCVADLMTIHLIPETRSRTSLGNLRVGDHVNIEFDYLAKAVAATLAARRL